LLDRQLERWYALIDIDVQVRLSEAVSNGVRFPVVPAGRRSGKTERAKRFVAKQAMKNADQKYFLAAPSKTKPRRYGLTICAHLHCPAHTAERQG